VLADAFFDVDAHWAIYFALVAADTVVITLSQITHG